MQGVCEMRWISCRGTARTIANDTDDDSMRPSISNECSKLRDLFLIRQSCFIFIAFRTDVTHPSPHPMRDASIKENIYFRTRLWRFDCDSAGFELCQLIVVRFVIRRWRCAFGYQRNLRI